VHQSCVNQQQLLLQQQQQQQHHLLNQQLRSLTGCCIRFSSSSASSSTLIVSRTSIRRNICNIATMSTNAKNANRSTHNRKRVKLEPQSRDGSQTGPGTATPHLDQVQSPSVVLMWFRMDLRSSDNKALSHAIAEAKERNTGVVGLFVVSASEWVNHDQGPPKIDFLLRNAEALKQRLENEYNIPLLVRFAAETKGREHIDVVANLVCDVAQEISASSVFVNKMYEVNEAERDVKLGMLLQQKLNVDMHSYHDQCCVPPGLLVAKSSGNTYKVFTPFKRSWIARVKEHRAHLESDYLSEAAQPHVQSKEFLERMEPFNTTPVPPVDQVAPFGDSKLFPNKNVRPDLFPAGESEAHRRLNSFADHRIRDYDKKRDFPSVDGTSSLSPYLTVGVLSPRQCINAALERNNHRFDSGSNGAVVWISEVIWREFYRHILSAFPRVCRNRAFQQKFENIPWNYNDEHYKAWCEGRTGYPLVDAAMRQLNQTGWMHNRLRMVTAMFLTKDLLLDWRLGERYFSHNLVDHDLASNNGGWQWAASTGTDAQPYFRIFAPVRQSERFDASGDFIKTFVPELKSLAAKQIHDPTKSLTASQLKKYEYPKQIVDHSIARKVAIAAFETARRVAAATTAAAESHAPPTGTTKKSKKTKAVAKKRKRSQTGTLSSS
jgi:deoxyribodipyrimidine photo-lyase